MPGGLGAPELIIVAVLFILLFGAKKLPELGGSIGKSIKNFKRGIDEANEDDAAPAPTTTDTPRAVSAGAERVDAHVVDEDTRAHTEPR